jgi:integral membrane protein (TIGR00529 family)
VSGDGASGHHERGWIADILLGIWPFAVVIAGVLALKVELIVIVLAVTALLAVVGRVGGRDVLRALRKGAEFQIVTLVIGVAAFQHMLAAAGIVDAVPEFFSRLHLPELFALFGLPMLIGLITGVTLAYIAVAFPLLVPLMGGDDVNMTLVMFAYGAGFVGVLLSPVHLCLVLSREYFGASLGKAYRLLLLPSALILAVATVLVVLFA